MTDKLIEEIATEVIKVIQLVKASDDVGSLEMKEINRVIALISEHLQQTNIQDDSVIEKIVEWKVLLESLSIDSGDLNFENKPTIH
jgi:hypothetical protein